MSTSEQHKATPEQWSNHEKAADIDGYSSCIPEPRARVKALEHFGTNAKASLLELARIVAKTGNTMEALEATQQRPPHQDKLDRLMALNADDGEPMVLPSPRATPSADRMLALQDQIRDGALTLADAVKEIDGKTTIRPLVEGVATDAKLCQVYTDAPSYGFDGALRAVYDLGRQHGAAPIRSGPESPLVERVADAIAAQATSAGIVNDRPARAAILEVEAWLREQRGGCVMVASTMLRRKANR